MQLAIEYPDTFPDLLSETPAEFEQEARMAMAAKLYERGRLSSGHAAKLAGLSRVDFLFELNRLDVSFMNITEEDILADFKNA